MHILEIPSFFPPYGGAFCLDQSKALAKQGNTVRIVACVQLGMTISKWKYLTADTRCKVKEMDGITVFYRQMRGLPKSPRLNMHRWVRAVCRMTDRYVARYGRPDIIHAHCGKWAGYAAMKLARKWNVPYVVTEHLSHLVFAKEFGTRPLEQVWQIPLLKDVYRQANLVIPVSAELVDDIAPYFGREYHWVDVSNTIDTDFFVPVRRQPLQDRPFVFCCLAMFIPLKGYDVLLDAFCEYVDRKSSNVRLIIAGTYTDSPALTRMVEERGLKDVVDIRGLVDKSGVRNILYESDCLVLASRSEAQPLVLLEAMSTGIPVISTEVVPKNQRLVGCLIVPIDDAHALYEKMCEVSDNYTSFDGDKISAEVGLQVSPQAVGKRLTELFQELL